MKLTTRMMTVIMTALTLLCMLPEMPRAAAAALLRGDCDQSGEVDANDAAKLQSWLLTRTGTVSPAADMNADGAIDAVDLTLLKRFLMPKTETAALMVYVAGSNLETRYAEASNDLAEMEDAVYTDGLTVTAMTGGSKRWFHNLVGADGNYLLTFSEQGVTAVKTDGDTKAMDDPDTLRDFITETAAAHPADHYALILWGHGCGPLFGVCHDELTGGLLTLPEIRTALTDSGIHFDWVGFDSCMMGTVETAYALRGLADYMLASEDTVSARGMDYETFLSEWAADPTVPAADVAKAAIDCTVGDHLKSGLNAMLSCWDLAQAETVTAAYCDYIADVYAQYQAEGIAPIYAARNRVIDYDNENYDVADLMSLITELPQAHSDALREAVSQAMVYHRASQEGNGAGMGVWFFERHPGDGLNDLPDVFAGIGMPEETAAQLQEMCSALLESYGVK